MARPKNPVAPEEYQETPETQEAPQSEPLTKDGCTCPILPEDINKPMRCGRGIEPQNCKGAKCKWYAPPAWMVGINDKKAELARLKVEHKIIADKITYLEEMIAKAEDKKKEL